MNILGIGPFELLIIAIIALVVLGPKGLSDLGHKTGRLVRKVTRSPWWQDVVSTTRDINELPGRIMRDIDLDDRSKENLPTAPPEEIPPIESNKSKKMR